MIRNKRQLLNNHVLHSKKTLQLCKFVLFEDFFEDVDVCMDMMKYMHHWDVYTYPLYLLVMKNIQINFGWNFENCTTVSGKMLKFCWFWNDHNFSFRTPFRTIYFLKLDIFPRRIQISNFFLQMFLRKYQNGVWCAQLPFVLLRCMHGACKSICMWPLRCMPYIFHMKFKNKIWNGVDIIFN